MNKLSLFYLLVMVALIQISVPAITVYQNEMVLYKGSEFLFKTIPLDPSDPFRGKYVTLRFEEEEFETLDTSLWQRNESVYILIDKGVDGFARVKRLSRKPMSGNSNYFKGRIKSFYLADGKAIISLDFPFKRYYMKESKAPRAEAAFERALRDSGQQTFAVTHIKNGKSVLVDVKIGEISLKDVVSESKND